MWCVCVCVQLLQDRVQRQVLLASASTLGVASGEFMSNQHQLVSWNHTKIVLLTALRFGLAKVEITAKTDRWVCWPGVLAEQPRYPSLLFLPLHPPPASTLP